MTKFIEISWSYYPTYGNGDYVGEFAIPVALVQSIIHEDITDEEKLAVLVDHIQENMMVHLGEIEGKHSEVSLDSDEIDVDLTTSYSKPDLDSMEYDSLMTSLVEAIFSNGFYRLESRWEEEWKAASYLSEELEKYEEENVAAIELKEKEQRPAEIIEEIAALVAEYKELTGELPTIE